MRSAAAWHGLRDRAAAERAVGALRRWADAAALEMVEDAGPQQSNTNSIYSLRRALIGLLGSWLVLRSAAAEHDRATIDGWLDRLAAIQDTPTGAARSRADGEAVSNRNNHALLRATVDALTAARTGAADRAQAAADMVAATLRDMRADGSLPLETRRGARALWYQRHAIASIVHIGEHVARFGHDVWAPRADGRSLHDAVRFLIEAVESPARVAGYASAEAGSRPGSRPDVQDLGFLGPRGHGRHYMAWIETYRARFPSHPNGAALAGLLRPRLEAVRPLIDEISGGNTTCFAATPRRERADLAPVGAATRSTPGSGDRASTD
nr:alginate lyase family protein [Rhodoplanes tepidamans]